MYKKNIILNNASIDYPIINENEVCFLYKGKADNVFIVGDFNNWELTDNMERYVGQDIWYIKRKFPKDARIEYKYIVDQNWTIDPNNRSITDTEYCCNSTVTMPGYKNNMDCMIYHQFPKGEIIKDLYLASKYMEKKMNFKVYIPYGFKDEKINNFIYVIDGSDYLEFGDITTTIDFLMYKNCIPKSIVVFIDPSERTNEYKLGLNYMDYIKNELIPHIENTYTICRDYIERTIIGVSWGAMTAMYIAMTSDNLIDYVITQSGYFWAKDWMIFDIINQVERKDIKFCIQSGMKNDTELMNERLNKLLKDKGYSVVYQKYNEGDNWTNWKNHLSDALVSVFKLEDFPLNNDITEDMDYIIDTLLFD
ncbi:alpha/beta hydrolase-fold protein [Pseudobacteroides cellulosolvens]|uniref:Esterase n=1 Tax=Pseudobacteroides cellulosolvens ATCC 35603 = DSM 2933 TaxID=398512 RepID=A0A0L6JQM5_9FIRM|nr:alpha/beta hydrolase-fold protein [Pseudobacteroides cellulosolvens]KNY27667.1 esterase [Pseudobacteroides cellulosolvens ATCC 35603 = DSM 2933]